MDQFVAIRLFEESQLAMQIHFFLISCDLYTFPQTLRPKTRKHYNDNVRQFKRRGKRRGTPYLVSPAPG